MREWLRYILTCVMLLLAFVGCDVHEFPEDYGVRVPFLLHLDFSTEMPLYKEILYTRGGEAKEVTDPHDIRYIINAYRIDNKRSNNRVADTTFVFSKSDISDLNYTAYLQLPEGTYDFKVWADYVDAGSTDDKYYDTRDFAEIILADKGNHSGSNDYRDAFRGYASATVTNPDYYTGSIVDSINNQATVEMQRPMGKFKFVSTDVELFLIRVAQRLSEKGVNIMPIGDNNHISQAMYEQLLQRIDLEGFKIIFRYNLFMPCSFNMFTDRPADSWTGVSFSSPMRLEREKEMLLGYDYIFVNGSETTLSISLEVYADDGELLSSTNPINVPIVRSKLTVVKGEFLTSEATGGVSINPGYEGDDYNIEIH